MVGLTGSELSLPHANLTAERSQFANSKPPHIAKGLQMRSLRTCWLLPAGTALGAAAAKAPGPSVRRAASSEESLGRAVVLAPW